MQSLRSIHPELATFPTEKLVGVVNWSHLGFLLDDLTEYYVRELPMWRVLNHYGMGHIDDGDVQVQVPCLWPEHGGVDERASARYFPVDRNTGDIRGSVYCYKCQRARTSIWYVHVMERQSLSQTMVWLEQFFGVLFPRDLFLDFDPMVAYSFEEDQRSQSLLLQQMVRSLRSNLRYSDPEYRAALAGLLV